MAALGGDEKENMHTHLLSLFCSRIAKISLQYSLLASNGIFAWEQTGRETEIQTSWSRAEREGPSEDEKVLSKRRACFESLAYYFPLPTLSGEGLLKVSPRKVKKLKRKKGWGGD